MTDRRRTLEKVQIDPISDGPTSDTREWTWWLITDLYYVKGKGYYVFTGPEGLTTDSGGATMRSIPLGLGAKEFFYASYRFSAKTLATMVVPVEVIERIKARVLEQIASEKAKRAAARQASGALYPSGISS